jgi:hypothetical protein
MEMRRSLRPVRDMRNEGVKLPDGEWRRNIAGRWKAILAVLAIGAAGVAWTGCGDDDNDTSSKIQENIEQGVTEAEGAIEDGVDEAQDALDNVDDQNKKDLEEAKEDVEEGLEKGKDEAQEGIEKGSDEVQKGIEKAED